MYSEELFAIVIMRLPLELLYYFPFRHYLVKHFILILFGVFLLTVIYSHSEIALLVFNLVLS